MDLALIFRTIYAFAVVGVLLLGLYWLVRTLGRGRLLAASDKRLVSVIDSTFLAQNSSVHVVKVADRYFLVGGGTGGVSLISELPAESVAPWLDAHRQAMAAQTASLGTFIKRLRLPRP